MKERLSNTQKKELLKVTNNHVQFDTSELT